MSDPYPKKLLFFLSVATFFEGYDFFALAQVLPALRADFGLSRQDAGWLFGFVNIGTILAFLIVRLADRWGRKRLLFVTILGYSTATLASGLAPNIQVFAVCQLLARVFLIGEWATSSVIAAEEYPAEKRGWVIGLLHAFSSLGAIVCAGVAPVLSSGPLGWRAVYLAAVPPLLVIAVMRRSLRETSRFQAIEKASIPWRTLWKSRHRRRILELGLIWFSTYLCSNTSVSFWKDFAMTERGFSETDVAGALTIAALASMPLVFLAGRLLDVLGRRRGAVIIFGLAAAGVYGAYEISHPWLLTGALTVAIFGVAAVLPVLNTFTSELFPTELRGAAFAVTNNLVGRLGFVAGPILVGIAADTHGWGAAIRPTALFLVIALGLILWRLPETNQLELEQSARL